VVQERCEGESERCGEVQEGLQRAGEARGVRGRQRVKRGAEVRSKRERE